jgi:non-specific serine/threonine protein kinase
VSEWAGRLPQEVTSFVGRQRELAEIERLLADARLVTLTGVGGVGKTRVALRAARKLAERFADGVRLVELSSLQDGTLLPHAVAEALGMVDQTARPHLDVLAEFVVDRRLLLVLDGCEHIADSCAMLAGVLMGAGPDLRIIATSRQPLDIATEQVVSVPPLPVPDPQSITEQDGLNESAMPNDSMTLFVQRGSEVTPGFALTAGNRGPVAELCRRLDGIPLAIELAASRLRDMPADQILTRLEDRFQLLGDGHKVLPRHQTLRTAIGWSHELCTPAERLLWARLSVFARGLDLEAAEATCSDERLPRADIAELMEALARKSILLRDERDEHDARARFRLLDTIREYGRDWLRQLGEERAMLARHRDYYLELARQGEGEWHGPQQTRWSERMVRELGNIRAALEFSLSDPAEAAAGLDMAGTLWFLWVNSVLTKEGSHYLDRALSLVQQPSAERTKALWVSAWATRAQGNYRPAMERVEACQRESAERGDADGVTHAIQFRGSTELMGGDPARGAELLTEAVERYGQDAPFEVGPIEATVMLGVAFTALGQTDRAVKLLLKTRRQCEAHGELWWRSHLDWLMAMAELTAGAVGAAAGHARDALRLKRGIDNLLGMVMCIELLAATAAMDGQGDRAATLHGAVERLWHTFAAPHFGSPVFAAVHDLAEREARDKLGDAEYQACFQRGTAMNIDQAVACALDEA